MRGTPLSFVPFLLFRSVTTNPPSWRLIWQCAGILGLDPGNFTLRELLLMTQWRQREQWNHTSAVLAMLVNVNRDPKKRPIRPDSLHPMYQQPDKVIKTDLKVLKRVFVDQQPRK